jgi:hypothetical protein
VAFLPMDHLARPVQVQGSNQSKHQRIKSGTSRGELL